MQICKHLKLIGKAFGGDELYECKMKDIRLRLGAPICFGCKNYEPDISQMP